MSQAGTFKMNVYRKWRHKLGHLKLITGSDVTKPLKTLILTGSDVMVDVVMAPEAFGDPGDNVIQLFFFATDEIS